MLARSAQGLYWMSRYLERAQHLCRLLRLQTESLVDRPLREIRFGWLRIYHSVGREPPEGSLEAFDSEDYTLADSYTLADDITFERLHPDSVWSCLALGRENARQMRQCISAEMWTCLNRTYLRLRDLEIQNIWRTSPESFYAQTSEQIDTLSGVAAATMYRDTGWRFMQLGRAVERAQLSASLLLAQLAIERMTTSRMTPTGPACCAATMPWRSTTGSAASRSNRIGSWTCWSRTRYCQARSAERPTRRPRRLPP